MGESRIIPQICINQKIGFFVRLFRAKRRSLWCPATGRLTTPGKTVSAHWPWLVCAQIQSGGSAAVEEPPAIKPGTCAVSSFLFLSTAPSFEAKGGPPVFKKPARHLPRQGRVFIRPPIWPMPPTISSTYGGESGGQLNSTAFGMLVFSLQLITMLLDRLKLYTYHASIFFPAIQSYCS